MQHKQMDTTTYRAYTNIALIKYWGKRNKELFLPVTSSLSLTLNEFYTETTLEWNTQSNEDTFTLDGQIQDINAIEKVSRFINMFRDLSGIHRPVHVKSTNHVPTAAGLASSASAFAALASACNDLFGTNLSNKELSTYARRGSGSATRSLFGGFTVWHKGIGDEPDSSYAEMIDEADWDIGMLVVMINKEQKKISSRVGMEHTIKTSPFYKLWPETVAEDLEAIIPAIENRDFPTIGQIAEHNAMKMHATIIAADPSMTYWEPESLTAMNIVRDLREAGIPCYFTMDAGPNVKVLCRLSQAEEIKKAFEKHFSSDRLVITGPGKGPHKIS
ncbi:diphosphomevalonate decarboxylase [Ruoffia tabacinasalis]|uniref:diphosphomevalonate decarboxylase n=1 Tax=Ruoffia tabacinasalis TaxID=87458 RepID=UPI0030CBB960